MTNADRNSGLKRVAREAILAQRLRNLFRIDENLSADLGYITHAEYQLFLDEKRAAGEYFQPDHWTGYTFPKGRGRLPVVGVRPADAAAFCAWLTQHDETATVGGWRYRLPQPDELATYGLHATEALGTVGGYWVRKNESFVFNTLDKRIPMLTRTRLQQRIERDRALDRDLTLDLDLIITRDLYALDLTRALTLTPDLAPTLARAHARGRVRTLTLTLDRALIVTLDRTRDLALTRDLAHARALTFTLDDAHARARTMFEKDPWQFLRLYLRFSFILVASLLLASNDKQVQASGEPWLDVYVDWVILEERIEGTLPAFEGIRIVKERVKEE